MNLQHFSAILTIASEFSRGITWKENAAFNFKSTQLNFLGEVSVENGPERAFSVSGRPSDGLYFLKTCYIPEREIRLAFEIK